MKTKLVALISLLASAACGGPESNTLEVLIFDHTERSGQKTLIFDDSTGHKSGIPLSDEIVKRLAAAQLPTETPGRGDNGKPNTNVANIVQQAYFTDVATKVVLPLFKERNKPFVLVFWSGAFAPRPSHHNS